MILADSQTSQGRHDRARGACRRQAHFTFAGAAVAAAIVLLVLACAASLLYLQLLATAVVDARLAATAIAQKRVEALRSLTFTELAVAGEMQTRVNSLGAADAAGPFMRTTTVGAAAMGARQVTVTVTSARKSRRPELSLSLTTILMDRALLAAGGES